MLVERGILYAPDFVINAGGVINVYHELHGYNRAAVEYDIAKIADRLTEIFAIAAKENIPTQEAAKMFARQRMAAIAGIHTNFIPK